MHDFFGDLLIGGDRLKHLHGQLCGEAPHQGNHDWDLAGSIELAPGQSGLLQTERTYRLELADGRAGQVIVSRIAADGTLADFQPTRLH